MEHFDVIEHRRPCLGAGAEAGVVDVLLLERGEEALHGRIVETVALAAHGPADAVPLQDLAVGLGGVLAPLCRYGASARAPAGAAAGPSPGRRRTARPGGGRPSTSRRSRAWPGPRSRPGTRSPRRSAGS